MSYPQIWLGSDESLARYIQNIATYHANRADFLLQEAQLRGSAKLGNGIEDDEEWNLSEYLAAKLTEVVGNVGIVRISGNLVSEESFMNAWFGDTAYSTVATAVSSLLQDPQVSQILTVWDTPGGDASGIYDFGTFLKDARKVKPVHAWTGTMALSAGYWGAACCQSIRASSLGETGSIGAVAKFRSIARMLEEAGIDTAVARSAPQKAILQPEEALSEQKLAYLQGKVDKLHGYFVTHLKDARGKLRAAAESTWATGAAFFADEAIAIGLVDGPEISLSALVSTLQTRADKARNQMKGNDMAGNMVLSDQMVAQLMSGVTVPGVELQDVVETDAQTEQTEVTEPTEAVQDTLSESAPVVDAKADQAPDQLVNYLQTKISDLEAKLLDMTLKAASAEAKLGDVSKETAQLEESLRPVVVAATQRLQVALGQAIQPFTDVPSRAVAASYHESLALLEKRLPSGRVSQQGQDETRHAPSLAELRLVSSAK